MNTLYPEIILVVGGIILFLADLRWHRHREALLYLGVFITLVAGGALLVFPPHLYQPLWLGGMVAGDRFAVMIKLVIIAITLFTLLISGPYFGFIRWKGEGGSYHADPLFMSDPPRVGDYVALNLFTTAGATLLATSTDLIAMYVGLETMSIGLYGLSGMLRDRSRSGEGAIKYLLLGGFASAFLLMGIALLFGTSGGNTHFSAIRPEGVAILGVGLVWFGFLFKVAAFPFHFWAPDVYQGAPTPVTALMSATPKAAILAMAVRLFGWAIPATGEWWKEGLWLTAAATMSIGNIVALAQTNLKRMLAYSSIAHAGYLLIAPLVAAHPQLEIKHSAGAALLFYLTVYYLMNLSAFTIAYLINRSRSGQDYEIESFVGLAARHPWLALGMGVVMVSLAGIPPTAGFFAKFYLFSSAVKAGYVGLVVIAVINSVISVYYYLRLVVYMYMRPLEQPMKVRLFWPVRLVIGLTVLILLWWGIYPSPLYYQARRAAESIVLSAPLSP